MKAIKIGYWVTTGLLTLGFLMSSMMYFTKNPQLVEGFQKIGFPLFMIPFLGLAKLLGAIGIINPWFPKIREWSYAGYTFVLLGATWLHISTQTPFVSPLVFLALVAVSYYLQTKFRPSPVAKA